jgi:hypothetical protein
VRHALQYLHRIVAGVLPPMFMAIEASRVLGALLALLSCYALLASSSRLACPQTPAFLPFI